MNKKMVFCASLSALLVLMAATSVTACGYPNCHEIPEFTTMGAGLALAGIGAYIYKKRSKK